METRAAGTPKAFGRRKDHHQIIFAKGERITSVTLNPLMVGAIAGLLTLFAVVYLGATTYLFFRDDLIGAAMARQARMQHAYEDRIAALRSEVDRITSRQLIDQESFEIKLDRLLAKQNALSDRQVLVTQVIEQARKNGIELASTIVPQPKPGVDLDDPDVTGGIGGELEPAEPMKSSMALPSDEEARADDPERYGSPYAKKLDTVATDMTAMLNEQGNALDALALAAETDVNRFEKVLKRIGVRLAKADPMAGDDADNTATGGPFVPLSPNGFADRIKRAETAITRLTQIRKATTAIPLRKPIGNAPVTSRYGPRIDPFLGRPAMHTGIDFRGTTGTRVNATANGRVVIAGRKGGYGNTVEIDHGRGLRSRYSHLSRISVKRGQRVVIGQKIGEVGSTGRSTGPHLHYETRVGKKTINPMLYLSAGRKLGNLL
ncbi:peptidoglycan DD-metalloendopeptidase family protein [Rhodobium gokarnense]|uniref:Murein DD-endopeptidase MepM/ murein hydrolase activator NlpD n=1 Tax=Rhodobium gokarnense TaxID=364296 RepID=A0ABT3HAJ2_9HYPH|nr:peptidoglycan DD-metalloendopeptidase family protein [Rhodobium gokarnense]MCW2307420.1 murein DD-endopeptidase MepM/ murein hydrolase activator NlpD [Rhodobium gokarnense]